MTLEPTARIVLLIIAAHAAVIGGWWWMQHAPVATRGDQERGLHWFSPKDMATPAAQPVSPEFAAQQQPAAPPMEAPKSAPAAAPEPPAAASAPKFNVTVSPKTAETSAGGIEQSARMTEVDEAIVHAFKQNWIPPTAVAADGKAIDALMDIVITRDGRVTNYMLVKPSGSSQIDMSALRACGLVKRIATPLPSQFSGDSYEVQLHFRTE